MKDSELQIDRSCHVLYSKPCKKEIRAKIALHYPEAERETIWEQVQRQYADFLSDWRTDLGGKKNFHNGVGGTYVLYDDGAEVILTAQVGAPVGEKDHILPLYLFPCRLSLCRRIMQGDFCPYLFLAGL